MTNEATAIDFNDMAYFESLAAVANIVDHAAPAIEPPVWPEDDAKPSVEASPLAPPVMPTDAFPGLLGAIVQASTVNSEAHPVAVAANVLAMFC